MHFGTIIDKNIKSLWYLLWIFETRIAITIMRDQHQHHDCEEDITIISNIEIIVQLYCFEHCSNIKPQNYAYALRYIVCIYVLYKVGILLSLYIYH